MTGYKLYPNLPSSAPPENPQVAYHLSVIQAKMQGLIHKEQMFKKKYETYTEILNRLTWLNACSSGITVATGISSVATFATFVRIPVSVVLGVASMTGAIASGIILVLAKKYQKKLKKVTCLIGIITPALVVFERVISGALKNGVIDEEEFNTLQTLHLETLKGELQRQNKLISSERPFKILQNETKIIKIGQAVLEIFNFKDRDLDNFTRKNDRKTENVVFLEDLHRLKNNRLCDVRNDKCTYQQ